jgi:hypothetical protein
MTKKELAKKFCKVAQVCSVGDLKDLIILHWYKNAGKYDIDGFIGIWREKTLVICMKETDSFRDFWKIEIDFFRRDGVHRGFLKLATIIREDLYNFCSVADFKDVFLCGWSLGADIVLPLSDMIAGKKTVVTFGASRIFSKKKARQMEKDKHLIIFNYCNGNDFFTKILPPWWGFYSVNPIYTPDRRWYKISLIDHLLDLH